MFTPAIDSERAACRGSVSNLPDDSLEYAFVALYQAVQDATHCGSSCAAGTADDRREQVEWRQIVGHEVMDVSMVEGALHGEPPCSGSARLIKLMVLRDCFP
jgi:hypothetical protein